MRTKGLNDNIKKYYKKITSFDNRLGFQIVRRFP
jgi:hypothetical protein